MGNKDEKTFTDIFSSSTQEQETTAKTFSDILNDNNDKENKEPSNSITFDSLFDKIPSKEIEKDKVQPEINTSETPQDSTEAFNFNTSFENGKELEAQNNNETAKVQPEINTSELPQDSIEAFNFNTLFENEKELEAQNNNEIDNPSELVNTQAQDTPLQNSEINSLDISDFNPFFENKTEENTHNEEYNNIKPITEINDKTFQTNTGLESVNQENTINPFFEEKKEEENIADNSNNSINILKTESKEKSNELENIFFQQNNTIADTSNQKQNEQESNLTLSQNNELNFNNNPFINNEILSNETQQENRIEEKITEANPFFEKSIQNEENKIDEPIQTPVTTINTPPSNEVKTNNDLVPTSTSPFFEEEKKSEANPFFQNQLNLIENQAPGSTNSNIDTSNTKHYNVKVVKKKEPLIKFIIGVLSYALFIFLLLIGVALLAYVMDIKIRAAKGDYSSPTFNAYVVLTGSMLPEIQVYDVVVTKKVEAKELKEGDVITFASADSRFLGTIITHRIIKKNPPTGREGYTFQTRGDNNNVADSALVPENNIYGKVILKIPKLGYLQEFLASDGGWIIVILIPCLTVISYDIVKLVKGLKRKKYKNIKVQK